MQGAISEFFSTAVKASQTETGLIAIVAAFACLTIGTMIYRLCQNGFDFRASFRPVMRKRNNRGKRKQ